jgi:hypothetical protein
MAFNDARDDRGGMSIPVQKFDEMIKNGSLEQVLSDRVRKNPSRKVPRFQGFEDFVVDGRLYRVERTDGRAILFLNPP